MRRVLTSPATVSAARSGPSGRLRVLAWLWLLLAAMLAVHQWQFWRAGRLDTDIMALLPASERTATADRVLHRLADGVSREVVVLVGARDWAGARAAAERFAGVMATQKDLVAPVDRIGSFDLDAALAFYGPHREALLTDAQRATLTGADGDALAQQAIGRLYQLAAGPRLTDWKSDPLGLWPDWWLARASATRVGERDGQAFLSADGLQWVLLTYRTVGQAFSVSGATDYADLLARAGRSAREGADAHAGVKVVAAGIPLHAEAAAAQASFEMNVIGLGSLAAVLLLVWLAFRSLRPIVLVALSLLVGTAAAISATALVFGQVHLITMVFGASLVGVAEDYGIHYFVTRQARPGWQPQRVMRFLLPGMALALGTSVAAYLALGVAPFPGLRQMALFSAVGLTCAFLTVVCWFPWLDRAPVRSTRLSGRLAASLARWPRMGANLHGLALLAVLAIVIVPGLLQVRAADDVRQLQSSPPALVEAQRTVGRLTGMPSPAQFILVRGDSPDQVLAREESVKAALHALIAAHDIAGVLAVSDWVPSAGRQRADAALATHAAQLVRERVSRQLGADAAASPPAQAAGVLTVQDWLANPVSQAMRHLWLGREGKGYASVMLVRGLESTGSIGRVATAVDKVQGAQWVDRVADFSTLLKRYRLIMTWLLVAGAVAVASLLFWRYGAASWRAMLPTLLAAALSVALLGWLNVPLQLFSVLALALLLGVGVDYGIFLLEHPGDGESWTAIVLGAASTLLAFGLLALSATPALHAFGMTMLSGVGAVWLLSPWFRPPAGTAEIVGE